MARSGNDHGRRKRTSGMREQGLDGHVYITASAIATIDGYADVDAALLRTWIDEGLLAIVTRGQLAQAFGAAQPPDPDLPARWSGPSGPENIYRWDQVVRVETDTRLKRRRRGGNPRAGGRRVTGRR